MIGIYSLAMLGNRLPISVLKWGGMNFFSKIKGMYAATECKSALILFACIPCVKILVVSACEAWSLAESLRKSII